MISYNAMRGYIRTDFEVFLVFGFNHSEIGYGFWCDGGNGFKYLLNRDKDLLGFLAGSFKFGLKSFVGLEFERLKND